MNTKVYFALACAALTASPALAQYPVVRHRISKCMTLKGAISLDASENGKIVNKFFNYYYNDSEYRARMQNCNLVLAQMIDAGYIPLEGQQQPSPHQQQTTD